MIGALMILLTKNVVHAVFMLILVFLGISGIYFVSKAEFVAVTQILVYIGGILILFMFGIMLTRRVDGEQMLSQNRRILPAIILGLGLLLVIIVPLQGGFPLFAKTEPVAPGSYTITEQIGLKFLTDHLLGLEMAAVLLLMALVAAALLAGTNFKKKTEGS